MDQNLFINITLKNVAQDEQLLSELVKRSKTKAEEKERQDYFNLLLEEKINAEKLKNQFTKKNKKVEENPNIIIPMYHQIKIQNDNLIHLSKSYKKKKCIKCGNISDSSKELSNDKVICNSCLQEEVLDFLDF